LKELKELLKSDNLVIMACQEYPGFPDEVHFWGGMGVVAQSISERLVKRGYEVLVIPRRVKEYGAEGVFYDQKNEVNVLSLPTQAFQAGSENGDLYQIYPTRAGRSILDHTFTTWRYLEKIGMKDPIFHCHDWLEVGTLRMSKKSGFRNILTVHMSAIRTEDRVEADKRLELERLAGGYADKIHYVSLAQMNSCRLYHWNHDKRHYVIKNGVDINKFTPPKEQPIGDYVFFVGRLTPVKNVTALVNGWRLFNNKYPGVELKILGASGISNIDVMQAIEKLEPNRRNKVELRIEMVSEEERLRYYRNSTVCCFPSSQEAFGIVAVEAQSCGKPVVVGDVGGFKENVLEGVTGVHVQGHIPEEIARGLELAFLNRKAWGKNARKLVKGFFSWDNLIDNYVEELYEE